MLASFVPEIRQHAVLFWILSLTIAFNTLGVSWFYQGVEDFKFITVRAIVIRTLSAASLFIFVRNSSDLIIYGIIIVCSTVGNNIINFIHLRKYLRIDRNTLSQLQIVRHIRPALKVFVLNLIISLYVQLNSIMLGFMSSETAVGYFTAGNKIIMICLTLIGSITTVLLPRCSNLYETGRIEEFANIIKNSSACHWLGIANHGWNYGFSTSADYSILRREFPPLNTYFILGRHLNTIRLYNRCPRNTGLYTQWRKSISLFAVWLPEPPLI